VVNVTIKTMRLKSGRLRSVVSNAEGLESVSPFRCGGNISDYFVADFLPSLSVKESVTIWRIYGQEFGDMFFESTI